MYQDQYDRIVRLERKVDFLFQRLGIDPGEALEQDGEPAASALPSSFHDALSPRQDDPVEAMVRNHGA
jgi:hypothetical protein